MPEPLKNCFSIEIINTIGKDFKRQYNAFDYQSFVRDTLSDDWEKLELKARMHRTAYTLGQYLPDHYQDALKILLTVAKNYSGLVHMLFADFVEQFGLSDFTESMDALAQLTPASSAEFAIRPFILKYPEQTMKQLKQWSYADDEHLRRLASEGCRPRLPWAMSLPEFKKDPTRVIDIITHLINDSSLYVRRSVANNLNDITKDNPEPVIEIANRFLGQSTEADWVIKHACRSLLKKGNKRVLALFGFTPVNHIKISHFSLNKQVSVGEKLNFDFTLESSQLNLGRLRLEFIIEFVKANGKRQGKIFKISEGEYNQNKKTVSKYFSFKPISTRKYYTGEHSLWIVINGEKVIAEKFLLVKQTS